MAIVRFDPLQIMRWPSVWDDEDWSGTIADSNLDIYETANEVVVRANVAGIPMDKIEITYEKGVLWVRGEEDKEDAEGKKYYRKASRSYSYKVGVPGNIDANVEPQAVMEDGVVKITFAKAEEAKPKKISIKAK